MINKWKKDPVCGNYCLEGKEGDNFFISYQPTNPERGEPETALCSRKLDKFYILLGDWRTDYEQIAHEGFEKCFDFYLSNKDFRSPLSEDVVDNFADSADSLLYRLQTIKVVLEHISKI